MDIMRISTKFLDWMVSICLWRMVSLLGFWWMTVHFICQLDFLTGLPRLENVGVGWFYVFLRNHKSTFSDLVVVDPIFVLRLSHYGVYCSCPGSISWSGFLFLETLRLSLMAFLDLLPSRLLPWPLGLVALKTIHLFSVITFRHI